MERIGPKHMKTCNPLGRGDRRASTRDLRAPYPGYELDIRENWGRLRAPQSQLLLLLCICRTRTDADLVGEIEFHMCGVPDPRSGGGSTRARREE